jgi:protoporphyrinogen oxidase
MNVAILGAGVTGLTAAWQLSKAGHRVKVLESGPRVGGNIRTELADG